jgi:TRAP-type transport system small permease protein
LLLFLYFLMGGSMINSIEWLAAVFAGIVATSYRGSHITVDLVWSAAGPRMKRVIDVFATRVLLFVVALQTAILFDKVRGTWADKLQTYDLNMPTRPSYAVAWAGDVCAVILIGIRTRRLIFQPELLDEDKPASEPTG